jgi:hypothetical protein
MDGVSSRSRQPLLLNRKLGVEAVAAPITSSSTSRMDISRERRTVSTKRREADARLGCSRRSRSCCSCSLGWASDGAPVPGPDRVEVPLIGHLRRPRCRRRARSRLRWR